MKSIYKLFCLAIPVMFISQLLFAQTTQMQAAPIVIRGSNIDLLYNSGYKATDLVAFRFVNHNWEQVPLQVDEKKKLTKATIKTIFNDNVGGKDFDGIAGSTIYSSGTNTTFEMEVYCATKTFVGADGDEEFDADDELVFMARHCGSLADNPFSPPAKVAGCTGVCIKVTNNRVTPAADTYMYIFYKNITLSVEQQLKQSADHAPLVNYNFRLEKEWDAPTNDVNYKSNCKDYYRMRYFNPEQSLIQGVTYTKGFSDRWVDDKLTLEDNVDILDRHKFQAAIYDGSLPTSLSNCRINEDAISKGTKGNYALSEDYEQEKECADPNVYPLFGTGAFIANKSGPIRAIRSYIGAGLYPLTQRDHYFYEKQEVIKTFFRAPAAPGFRDVYDYDRATAGSITYSNNINSNLLFTTSSGPSPTSNKDANITWEYVATTHGCIFRSHSILARTIWDVSGNPIADMSKSQYISQVHEQNCTGDDWTYAQTGVSIINRNVANGYKIPNTDPRFTSHASNDLSRLEYTQTNVYLAANASASDTTAWIAFSSPGAISILVDEAPGYGCSQGLMSIPAETGTKTKLATPVNVDAYPNPNSGMLNLAIQGPEDQSIIATIYNPSGKQIGRLTATGNLTKQVDLHANPGVGQLYVIKVKVGSKTITKKVIVNKE